MNNDPRSFNAVRLHTGGVGQGCYEGLSNVGPSGGTYPARESPPRGLQETVGNITRPLNEDHRSRSRWDRTEFVGKEPF